MPFEFPGEGQSPSPAETAAVVAGLVDDGYGTQLLLSHDLFLKAMLRKHGGNGLAYVPAVVAESTSLDNARSHVASLSNLVDEQREYFANLRARYPYSGDAAALLHRSSALSEYALGLAQTDGRPAALVGMFAAESLYLQWCRAAALVPADRQAALQEWIDLHTRPQFVQQVEALAREVDAMPETVTDSDLDRWFQGMLIAEIAFHEVVTT